MLHYKTLFKKVKLPYLIFELGGKVDLCLKLLDTSEDDKSKDKFVKAKNEKKKDEKGNIKCVSADVLAQILKIDDKIYEQMYSVAKIFMRKKKGFDIIQNIIECSGLLDKQTGKLIR